MPIATITLGWPAEKGSVSDRLPIEAIVHQEAYQPYTSQSIDQYYVTKEELPENKRFVEENKTETLAQIFTDIRYRPQDCQTMSKALIQALCNQGFM